MGNNDFEEIRLFFISQIESFWTQEKLPEALALARERLARFPADVEALTYIVRILIVTGRMEECRELLSKVDNNISRLSAIYLLAADNYRDKGLNREAVLSYQKFISFNPSSESSADAAKAISELEKEGNFSAAEIMESPGNDIPKPEFYTVTLAELYIKQGHWKMAADILTEIIKREPANIMARTKLDTVKAAIALKSSAGKNSKPASDMIIILSGWLKNIDRLKNNAR